MSEPAAPRPHGEGDQSSGLSGDMGGLPLFILSAAHRDALSACAAQAGWKPIAARRLDRAESRYLGSLARIAVIDLRGVTPDDALEMVKALAAAVEASGGALLLLVEDVGAPHVPGLIAAGATHLLDGEIDETRFTIALRTADKLAERLIGSLAAAGNRHAVARSDGLFWRWNGAERTLAISPALGDLLRIMVPDADHARLGIADLVRALDRADRAGAVAAIRRAVDDLMPSAFAHAVPSQPDRRLVQHLYPDAQGFSGEVEELDVHHRANRRDRDPMTGLASRQGAIRWLDHHLAQGRLPAVLLIGLGDFDRVNSAYGRLVGDAMLSRVAIRLQRLVDAMAPRDSLVARITGTEFVIAVLGGPETALPSVERATLLAQQIVAEISRPFNAGDYLIRLTARCGLAPGQSGDAAETILRRASNALADARRGSAQGGIRIRVADEASRIVDDDRLQNDLRHALDSEQIQLLFQPQYAMEDDSIVGVEALARWQHPHYGEIGAGALFAIAERSDFMLPLSDHIHARALAEAAAWPDELRDLRLAINVTAADISEPDFLQNFLRTVDASGFARERLTVELTESGLVEHLAGASLLLTQLREAGLKVAVDDFGTGYSSLAYLKALPLDYLKIDRSIARDIEGTARDRVIVRAIIDMGRSLGLGVIAEGVETEQQLALLARAGCTCYQGFLRSPAIASDKLADLVRTSKRGAT
ncbi:putative bifunctional diguanylate cyclase/phosphodiesterase [Sphingobium sp. B2D3C]|uniref:putative bifunctional diguanylate cyclase/phosphodiesterase n=1 Tax=Sphingobium sp. B2D3C TaxID=2940581 RepID=UPI0022243A12|nr:bifunctional diguanylate cyclase/phosphodiesterase [Sphingobium sp. B2D3C]MCW2397866.1 diguanylate cyclase (GGDEF)-like protein [Sphingobium sp. B2D3C]